MAILRKTYAPCGASATTSHEVDQTSQEQAQTPRSSLAYGGELSMFADADSRIHSGEGLHVIRLPEHYGVLSPILHDVPLKLLAHHTATARGTDVDKPQNLA